MKNIIFIYTSIHFTGNNIETHVSDVKLYSMENMTIKEKIQDEFNKRKSLNHSYSLRALARDLNINHSILSRIITSKLQMTPKVLDRIAGPLKLNEQEMNLYKNEVLQRKKKQSKEKIVETNLRKITIDEFKTIQAWYNFAIIELTSLPDFDPNAEWIAKKLGISEQEAKLAVTRLEELELIKKSLRGNKYEKTSMNMTVTSPDVVVEELKASQKTALLRAIDSLDMYDLDKRDQSNIMIAIDSQLLPEIKDKIKKMRRSLANYIAAKSKKPDSVYELSISFFPWTQDN